MIKTLKLKFGKNPSEKLEFETTPITVFVGPNNSGKSKILREIENFSRTTKYHPTDVIIENIQFQNLDLTEFEKELVTLTVDPLPNEQIYGDNIIISKINAQTNSTTRKQVSARSIKEEAKNPNKGESLYFKVFLDLYTLRLDGTNRLNLLTQQTAGDLLRIPTNHLSHLFINDDLRLNLRKIIFEAIGRYFVIDPTNIGYLRVKLSDIAPQSERQEKGWEKESLDFHSKAFPIELASDGVKAFVGILSTLIAGDPKITLIDEPEAFLHPALANVLGKEIGKTLRESKKRLFVSTHSSSFLMGCIQSTAPLNIVRLTYKNNIPTARLLPQDKILHLMRHPLLRSTGVLNGLFYESVVVCEADSDRAFYQEINERLLAENDERGISNCLFINAQNKQTVWDIVKPLRELGIPTIGIVDIDVLKEGGAVFTKLLDGAYIPTLSHQSLQSQRQLLYNAFNSSGKDMKRDNGINILKDDEFESCNNFFEQLKEYGVLVVKNGELESWLKNLGATSHGSNWLINIFQKMGENPLEATYLKPANDDVWNFLGELKQWLNNENRKGIPK